MNSVISVYTTVLCLMNVFRA